MPSFFVPGLQGLPPTPPHAAGMGGLDSEHPFYVIGQSAFPPRYPQNGCEFIEQFSQSAGYGKPGPMNMPTTAQQQQQFMAPHGRTTAAHGLGPQIPQPMFGGGPMAAGAGAGAAPTVLPPLRTNVQLPPMETQYAAAAAAARHQQDMIAAAAADRSRKEEKPTGGVAAHLDYEMDQMSDFVAEMAQGMYALYITKINLSDIDFARSVCPGTPVPPQFRKYVYQILSSTRLPSSTILLGLFYLANRMRLLSTRKVFSSGSGQVYRMLTVALLLGSKFLDDNTFQNKSWSEVSNIPVAELNSMELDWLFAFEWKIHDRIHDEHDGFSSWLSHWKLWRAKASAAVRAQQHQQQQQHHQPARSALASIDANVSNNRSAPGLSRNNSSSSNISSSSSASGNNNNGNKKNDKPLMSPEGPIPPQYQRRSPFENSWLNPAASEYSPPSAPHSGPTTPDYYAAGPWAAYTTNSHPAPPPYSRGSWMPAAQQPYLPSMPRSQPPSYHHTPSYGLPFTQSMWTGHGSSCGCLYCAKHMEHYMFPHPFGAMQPIMA